MPEYQKQAGGIMKLKKIHLVPFIAVFICFVVSVLLNSCAQIGAPTGGARDTIPPTLIKATPDLNSKSVQTNQIQLSFDEYIELQDISKNILISPAQKENPSIQYNLKNIRIRFKDSLKPSTTYVIDFGSAIRDINESNILPNFQYVFSTGNHIDSLKIEGTVILAETGIIDSTISVLLYEDITDTAVLNRAPDYLARLNGKGNFSFHHLPNRPFRLYALKDADGNKRYSVSSELFAFADSIASPSINPSPIALLAYAETKTIAPAVSSTVPKSDPSKPLRYTAAFHQGAQDMFKPLELKFNLPIKEWIKDSIQLTDTSFTPLTDYRINLDSTKKSITVDYTWKAGQSYRLISTQHAITDSIGKQFSRNDTLYFNVKKKTDYGLVKLRFNGLDTTRYPVLIIKEGELILHRVSLHQAEWTIKNMLPGEYSIEVLYDRNQNGKWDPGNFRQLIQPERVQTFSQKLSVRADWENDRTIDFE